MQIFPRELSPSSIPCPACLLNISHGMTSTIYDQLYVRPALYAVAKNKAPSVSRSSEERVTTCMCNAGCCVQLQNTIRELSSSGAVFFGSCLHY